MLTIQRPTKSTALFTVSTRPPAQTLAAQAGRYAVVLLRLFAASLVALCLFSEYRHTSSIPSNDDTPSRLEHGILASPLGPFTRLLISSIPRIWRLLLCGGVSWLILRKGYTEESLLVIRGLGVQTSTSSPMYLRSSSTKFIPTSSVQDILIHEAFKGFEVRFYLSIIVENEPEVVVVFPNMLPRRQILEQVWRGAKGCLYEHD